MMSKVRLAAVAVFVAAGLTGAPAWSQTGMKAGALTCDVASGWGFVVASSRDLKCTYVNEGGTTEHYTGEITKIGVDIGYHGGGIMGWAVLAPTQNLGKGALAGTYVGVTAGVAAGAGVSGNLLVGGSDKTISLQPLTVEGLVGINVAAGVAGITLKTAE